MRKLKTRYTTFDGELLAIYLAIRRFHHFVEGCCFHILTDHKPLTYALSAKSDRHSPRQIRHLDYVSQFTSDIRHVKGTNNPAADALSRMEVNALPVNQLNLLSFNEMARAQSEDPDLLKLQTSTACSLAKHNIPLTLPTSDSTTVYDTSTGVPRQIVLHKFRHMAILTQSILFHIRYAMVPQTVAKIAICDCPMASGDCRVALITELVNVGGVELVGNGRSVFPLLYLKRGAPPCL